MIILLLLTGWAGHEFGSNLTNVECVFHDAQTGPSEISKMLATSWVLQFLRARLFIALVCFAQ
jgi:hypothetical protein